MGSKYIPDLQHVCVYVAQDCAGESLCVRRRVYICAYV